MFQWKHCCEIRIACSWIVGGGSGLGLEMILCFARTTASGVAIGFHVIAAGRMLKFWPRNWMEPFGQDEGLGYGPVLGLSEVAPGVIWAARPKDGLYRWEGRNFSRLTAAGLAPRDPQVNALLVTRDGSCLVAHARGLLRFKDAQAVADESAVTGLCDLNIISLAEDSQGCVWAGTRQGTLWRLAKGEWLEQTDLRVTHPITAIVPGTNGSLWIGTDGGGL